MQGRRLWRRRNMPREMTFLVELTVSGAFPCLAVPPHSGNLIELHLTIVDCSGSIISQQQEAGDGKFWLTSSVEA
jgi:hypothetical protein